MVNDGLPDSSPRRGSLIDALEDGIILRDIDSDRVFDVNQGACALFRATREHLLHGSWADVSAIDEGYTEDRLDLYLEQVRLTGQARFEWRCQRRDGTRFWAEIRLRRISGARGGSDKPPEPTRQQLVAVVRDITEFREARERLRLAEERYRLLVRHIPGTAIVLCDHDLRLVLVDGAELASNGFSKADMEGRTIYECLPPEFVSQIEGNMRRVLSGETFLADIPFGSFWYRYNYVPILDDAGHVIWGMILALNITEQRRALDAMASSEARLRSLSEATFEGIAITANGRVIDANDQLLSMFQTRREDMVGQSVLSMVASESAPLVQTHLQSGLDSPYEHLATRHNGTTFPVEVRARTATIDGHAVRVTAVRDITERKRADQERDRLIAELSTRNGEMEQFTYTVSHDLRSPLVTITGFLGMLEQDIGPNPSDRVKSDIARIGSAANKMLRLLGDLLDLSRIGRIAGAIAPVSVVEAAREAKELLSVSIAERGAALVVDPNLPDVMADRNRVVQVIQNLVENAIKYMGDQPEPRIDIGFRPHATRAILFVKDNGIGVPEKSAERIFGLFEKLNPATPGTGVGLALVRRILEYQGGKVWVESDGKHGSTFVFELPRA